MVAMGRVITNGLGEKKVVVFRFHAQVLENGIRPEPFHVVLRRSVSLLCRDSSHTQFSTCPCRTG
jgi:hypothetical protein